MPSLIILRPASMDDLEILLEWRNDSLTREASHNQNKVTREEHTQWLTATLSNPNRQLYVAEENDIPIGTVRADFSDGEYELSWTVAPQARGRGVGKHMVELLANQIEGLIRAEIKIWNRASVRIAEYAGMEFAYEQNGIMHYQRPPRERKV